MVLGLELVFLELDLVKIISDSSANFLGDSRTYGDMNYKKYEINAFKETFICQELEVFEVKYL